jgi:hypothetical protein
VLYVAYDSATRGVQERIAHSRGMLGMALLLSPETVGMRLSLAAVPRQPASDAPPASANAMAECLTLISALEHGTDDLVYLPFGPESGLEIRLERG